MKETNTTRWRWMRFKWTTGEFKCAATIDLDVSDHRLVLHLALPFLFSVFVGVRMPMWMNRLPWKHQRTEYNYQGLHRSIGVRVFDSAIWVSFWEDVDEWRSRDPWWYRGRLGLDDLATLVFGRERVETTTIAESDTAVDMPEKRYPAHYKAERMVWLRPRLPRALSRVRLTSTLDVPGGVPVPGKGENSWDCDDDAIFSQSSSARTEAEALALFRESAMRTRDRYGGRRWRVTGAAA